MGCHLVQRQCGDLFNGPTCARARIWYRQWKVCTKRIVETYENHIICIILLHTHTHTHAHTHTQGSHALNATLPTPPYYCIQLCVVTTTLLTISCSKIVQGKCDRISQLSKTKNIENMISSKTTHAHSKLNPHIFRQRIRHNSPI